MKLIVAKIAAVCLASVVVACSSSKAKAVDDPGWPIQITHGDSKITIYQIQPESLAGDRMTGRAAVSIVRGQDPEPVFGTVWIDARIATDRDARAVTLLDAQAASIKFPSATPQEQEELASLLRTELPNQHPTFSLDELITTLDPAVQADPPAGELANDAPKIIFTTRPTALVTIDGKPEARGVPNSKMQRVINTPFVILLDPAQKTYWLEAGSRWMKAQNIEGPWSAESNPPSEVTTALPPATLAGKPVAQDGKGDDVDVMVVTQPTELIVADGAPQWTPIQGTGLSYLSNSENDVFQADANHTIYVVLAGRWYSSPSLEKGPWTYVASDKLPPGFARIPDDSPKADVRTFVAGTDDAREAVLDASIPQTAAIKRADAHCDVSYDGEPQFKEIPGTPLRYAVNTSSSVIEYSNRYYCCSEGVWYLAATPTGPWSVCTDVPDEIYSIPPSVPVYPVKYCYVYDSTPDYVYVGYLPAYTGCYVSGPTIVYGTGFWYPGWIGAAYYPCPWTWGFYPHYDPWYSGWSFGFSFGWGVHPGWFCHAHGVGHPGWWGPGGFHGHDFEIHGNIVRHLAQPGAAPGGSLGAIAAGRENLYNREVNAARVAHVPGVTPQRQRVAPSAINDVYAGRDGRVIRRAQDGGWEERQRAAWQRTTPQPNVPARQGPAAGRMAPQQPGAEGANPGRQRTPPVERPAPTPPRGEPSTPRGEPAPRGQPPPARGQPTPPRGEPVAPPVERGQPMPPREQPAAPVERPQVIPPVPQRPEVMPPSSRPVPPRGYLTPRSNPGGDDFNRMYQSRQRGSMRASRPQRASPRGGRGGG